MIDPNNPHSPENSVTLDFIGIGFEGGVKAALDEIARRHPDIKIDDIDPGQLRGQWAEKQADSIKLLGFNKYNDGKWMLSHAWAYRWIAYLFQDHMDTIGAKNYVFQEIDITPALPSGMKRIVIAVMSGRLYDRVKPLIEEAVDQVALKRKGV